MATEERPLEWEDPPEDLRVPYDWHAVAKELRLNPGRWAVFEVEASMASKIKNRKYAPFDVEAFEAVTERIKGTARSKVWIRATMRST